MKKKPTITTVAEHAGVAVSTVSRYLNGHYVSQSTKKQISKVIAKLGYSRSSTARNLSLGRQGCIGVVVDSTLDPWFTQLLAGIEEELSTRDISLMLASLELRGHYDADIVFEWVRERRVDGLILAKSQKRERTLVHTAIKAQLPVITVAPDEVVTDVQVIRCNNIAAGAAVADHLADLGHKLIAFAGGPKHSIDSKHRLRGLRDRLSRLGIPLHPRSISVCGSYEAAAGIEFARSLLAKPLEITALVMGNDALALGFMRVAQQRGIRIPQHLSIVGFDNVPDGALVWPGLTTMAQPMREMGRAACRRLFDMIEAPADLKAIEYPMELIVRESTGAVRDS
jgi:DNA-binding LacI/PurR family transcriptional regulator